MAMLPRVAVVAVALAVLQAGCAEKTTGPPITAVTLSLATSPAVGSPSQPIVADVRARNVGHTRVWHCGGCGCDFPSVRVLGPDGLEVRINDPNGPVLGCPGTIVPLEPKHGVGGRFVFFTGTLYVADHPTWPTPTYAAPPGTYTAIARFSYETSVPGEFLLLERRTTFVWAP